MSRHLSVGKNICLKIFFWILIYLNFRGRYTFHNYSNRLAAKLYARKAAKVIKRLKESEFGLNAFIAETYQSCGGQVIPPRKYFELIYKLVTDAGGVKIADEVQVGFGR